MIGTLRKNLPLFLALAFSSALISLSLLLPLPHALAATSNNNFNITEGITQNLGCSGFDCQLCNLVTLFNRLISFFIYLGTVAAVFLMAYVGFKYITAGGDSGATSQAKEIFWNVVIGFVIMLCAYLFIDTVLKSILEPEAVRFGPWNPVRCEELQDGRVSTTGPGTGPGSQSGGSPQHNANAETFRNNGMDVISSGNCSDPTRSTCTALDKVSVNTVNAVIDLKNAAGYPMNVTGGDEVGHTNQEQRNGNSLDIDFKDQSLDGNSSAINRVISTAEAQGRCAVWEVPSGSSCPTGVRRCLAVGHATGGHFSFYMNPSASPSCSR